MTGKQKDTVVLPAMRFDDGLEMDVGMVLQKVLNYLLPDDDVLHEVPYHDRVRRVKLKCMQLKKGLNQ